MIFQGDGHLKEQAIASYVDGRLSLAEFNLANTHMATCRRCLEQLAGTAKTMGALNRLLQEGRDENRSRKQAR